MKGIACRVGKADVGLPFAAVGQIIEYQVFPLPLARPYVAGLGLHDDWPLISLTLSRTGVKPNAGGSRTAKGILLHTGEAGDGQGQLQGQLHDQLDVRWALEVNDLGSFVEATPLPRAPSPGLELPAWISQADTADGKTIAWIDVAAMLQELATGPGVP
jgi:hypothetical protein